MILPTSLRLSTYLTGALLASCYAAPSTADFSSLEKAIVGSLVPIRPPAAPCYAPFYDAEACADARANWSNSTWRSSQAGAMQNINWEQLDGKWCDIGEVNSTSPIDGICHQGGIPRFAVEAVSSGDVVAGVKFASAHGISLVVKGTGHDYLGRSTDPTSLLIWTHKLSNITFGNVEVCGDTLDNAVTVGAGAHWGEVYAAIASFNRVVPGGADPNVGASGGQVQGGGHSPLSNTYGLTPDSVVQFEVVTMDGRTRTVNKCQNTDLFWALRGGGGGTYAVVLSTTFKTYPDGPTAAFAFSLNNTRESAESALEVFAAHSPSLAEMGWSGYFFPSMSTFAGIFVLPLINSLTIDQANSSATALLEDFKSLTNVELTTVLFFESPTFRAVQSQFLLPAQTGKTPILGSRLIPKVSLQDAGTRHTVVNTIASLEVPDGVLVLGHLVAGGAPSRPTDSAILPAWRKAIWHIVINVFVPVDASSSVLEANFDSMTRTLVEPLRRVTEGSGAYMNEADARAPAWKEDFFGENYGRLLEIKRRYDPQGVLKCNRCVGSDQA